MANRLADIGEIVAQAAGSVERTAVALHTAQWVVQVRWWIRAATAVGAAAVALSAVAMWQLIARAGA